jgi:hypothetical protein
VNTTHSIQFLPADAALPLVWFTFPAVVLMLIPTVLLEGFLLKIWLRIPTGRAFKASLIANAASTIAGVPLARLLSYLATAAVSPWTRELTQKEHWQSPLGDIVMAIANSTYISAYVVEAPWLLPAALLIILVPAYLLSWGIEYWIVKRLIIKQGTANAEPTEPSLQSINRAVRRANFVSYDILFAATAVMLIRSQFRS